MIGDPINTEECRHLAFDSQRNTPLCNLYVSALQRLGIETDTFASGQTTLSGLEA
jgi:hypothetical protein